MKSFLRDLAYLGLFAAAVAAAVLVIAIHQGRFMPPRESVAATAGPPVRSVAAMPVRSAPPAPEPDAIDRVPEGTMPVTHAAEAPAAVFDPTTRGVRGDARVICLPEVAWLQEQLSRWSSAPRGLRRAPPATLDAAHAAARRASAFEYQVSPECWNDPAQLEARGWGDCADKSLWLARELLQAGYTMVGIRLGVPEGYEPGEPGHAWVVFYHHGGEWIYDPVSSPRLMSQDAGPTRRFRITVTVFPR